MPSLEGFFRLNLPDSSIYVGWRYPEAHSANFVVIQRSQEWLRLAVPEIGKRRTRARRKLGRYVVPVEICCEMITALVDQGDVAEANSSDPNSVCEAIAAVARRGLDIT